MLKRRLKTDEVRPSDSFSRSTCMRASVRERTKTKVRDKGALSKHSCWICVHISEFVYTHSDAVYYQVPKGLFGRGRNKSPAHSHSPESQHLSAHIISQIPQPSFKKRDTFSILSPFLPSTCPSAQTSFSQCQEFLNTWWHSCSPRMPSKFVWKMSETSFLSAICDMNSCGSRC